MRETRGVLAHAVTARAIKVGYIESGRRIRAVATALAVAASYAPDLVKGFPMPSSETCHFRHTCGIPRCLSVLARLSASSSSSLVFGTCTSTIVLMHRRPMSSTVRLSTFSKATCQNCVATRRTQGEVVGAVKTASDRIRSMCGVGSRSDSCLPRGA